MRLRLVFAAVGFAVLAGCSSANELQEPQEPSPTSTTEAKPPSISGTVTIQHDDNWGLMWAGGRTVYNGEECRAYSDIAQGTQIVAKNSTGEIIGIGSLSVGGLTGLGSGGIELPDRNFYGPELRELKRTADCTFPFDIALSSESPFYSFGIEGLGDLTYSHAELVSTGWVVSLTIG